MTKMNNRAIGKIATAIIVICIIATSASVVSLAWNSLVTHPVTAAPTPTEREGFVAITVTELEPTTLAANAGAASTYTLYHLRDQNVWPISAKSDLTGGTALAVGTAGGFSVGKTDNKAVAGGYKQFIVLQMYSGTADYVSLKYMLEQNQGLVVDHQENVDLGIDGYPETLFLIDLTGQTLYASQAISTPISIRSFLTVADVTLSDNSPGNTDVAGAGAQSGSGVQNWQITVTTDNTGDSFVMGRVYLTFNDTEAYLTPKALTITAFDGTQTIISSPTSETIGTTSYIYYYPPSGNYRWTYNGLMMYRSSGSNTYVNIAWAYDFSFAGSGAGYGTDVFLYWDVVGSTSNGGTITAYNDDVVIDNWT